MTIDPVVMEIGSVSQSFVRDDLVAAIRGLERQVYQLKKVSEEPVLCSTESWEGAWLAPTAVHYDAEQKLWRMWYSSTGPRRLGQSPRAGTLHLAISHDGVQWTKQPLGLCVIEGASDNNLCVWENGQPMTGAVTVLDEPHDPDPAQRFKLIYYPGHNYYLAYSSDGLHWRPADPELIWANGSGDGLEECAFFYRDPLSGKYRGDMRVWRRHQTIRKSGHGESDDLRHWSGPWINWEAFPAYGPGAQIYGMHVHYDAGLYWAFPWMYFTGEPLDEELHETIRFRLAWSLDGVQWNPLAPATDLVPMGIRGQGFDWGMMFSTCPAVFTEAEGRLYYTGCNNTHDDIDSQRAIGLATWRRGGLVSLRTSGNQEGVLLTHRFLMRGNELRVNARSHGEGSISAELLNDAGAVIKTHSFATCDELSGDYQDGCLTWGGQSDLSALYGQNIMLRLQLRQAEVFSFRAAGPAEMFTRPLGPPPVRAGLCTEPPVIDGVLDDNAWQDFTHSGVADDFVNFERLEAADVRTRVLITRDHSNLYLGIWCEEPESSSLTPTRVAGPIKYSTEECVEIRLSAPVHGSGLYMHQLMVTASGGQEHNYFSKEAGESRGGLEDPWEVQTNIGAGCWSAEIAVPFASLGTSPPAAGERWRLNIIRHRQLGTAINSCWVCMFGSVHRNDLAGDLIFS